MEPEFMAFAATMWPQAAGFSSNAGFAVDRQVGFLYNPAVMYAIIEADGKQLRVREGDTIRCDAIDREVGSEIAFDRVVLASSGGSEIVVGKPLVAGATVRGTVLRQAKDKKILVFKYKPKKRVRKLVGHRQRFAEVRIDKIELQGLPA